MVQNQRAEWVGENDAALMALWGSGSEALGGYDQTRVADAVFWLAHGDGGRPLMRRRTLELALAGGLLGELALAGKIALWDGGGPGPHDKVAVFNEEPPADALSRYVYDQITSDPYQELAMWLLALRCVSVEKVRDRLGLARVPTRRGLLRGRGGTSSFVPTGTTADRAWAALTLRIRRKEPLSDADAFLIGAGTATGLRAHLLEGALPDALRHAQQAVELLPEPVGQVVTQLEVAVAKDTLLPP